jgi:hypothetical protein
MDRRKFLSLGAVALAPIAAIAAVKPLYATPVVMGLDLAAGPDVTAVAEVYFHPAGLPATSDGRLPAGNYWLDANGVYAVKNASGRRIFVRDRWIAPGETYEWPR